MIGEGGRGTPPGEKPLSTTQVEKDPEMGVSFDVRLATLRRIEKLANSLERQHAEEILDLIRDVRMTYFEIARKFVPLEIAESYPDVCQSAVAEIARRLIPAEELEALTYTRRSQRMKARIQNNPEAHKKQSKKAAKVRHVKGPPPDFAKMNDARGIVLWKPEEREMLFDLVSQPEFQHGPGTYAGKPDYKKIANELNHLFHADELVREPGKLGRVVVSDRFDRKTGRNKK